MGTSNASITNTSVVGQDTSATVQITSATVSNTTVSPHDTLCSISVVCLIEEPLPVGGIILPISKLALLAPYIGLLSAILAGMGVPLIYVRWGRR